jgi:hypothetical protein
MYMDSMQENRVKKNGMCRVVAGVPFIFRVSVLCAIAELTNDALPAVSYDVQAG